MTEALDAHKCNGGMHEKRFQLGTAEKGRVANFTKF
jgi:hypothetical protein